MGKRDSKVVWDGHVHTIIFKIDNQNDLLYSIGTLLNVAELDRRVWGRMDTCTYMAESLCCLPENITLFVNQLYLSTE